MIIFLKNIRTKIISGENSENGLAEIEHDIQKQYERKKSTIRQILLLKSAFT